MKEHRVDNKDNKRLRRGEMGEDLEIEAEGGVGKQ